MGPGVVASALGQDAKDPFNPRETEPGLAAFIGCESFALYTEAASTQAILQAGGGYDSRLD